MRRIIFFVSLISFELSALDPIVIQKALNGLEPLHMVTLTRSQVNDRNEIKRDDSNCLPITASEAVTVFSIVNLLFNESFGRKEFERCIELAKKHDFSNLEQINLLLADPLIRDKILKEKLETISKGKNQGWLIKNYKEELFPLEIQTKEKENYFILLKKAPSSRIKTINKTEIVDSIFPEEIKFEDVLECSYSVSLGRKIKHVFNSLDDDVRRMAVKGFPELRGYLTFNINDINKDYLSLFQKMSDVLKDHIIKGNVFFVSNELFFGKSFVLSDKYRQCMPIFPNNVLTCINFLIEEKEVLSHLSRIVEDPKFIQLELLDYQFYKNRIASDNRKEKQDGLVRPSFRSVSFYSTGTAIVQEYTKRSYFKEADEVILDDGYDYLFGTQTDFSGETNDFLPLISTQICFDLSSGVQKGQKGTPIHVVQSNTLSVLDNLDNIPVETQLIVHADPIWQQLLQKYSSLSVDLSMAEAKPEIKNNYSSLPPVETITFYIDKDGYKEAYTITHWILNKHLLQK